MYINSNVTVYNLQKGMHDCMIDHSFLCPNLRISKRANSYLVRKINSSDGRKCNSSQESQSIIKKATTMDSDRWISWIVDNKFKKKEYRLR